MAKQAGGSNANLNTTNSFIKGLNKDSDPSFVQEGMWTHARNAVNNTFEGDVGTLSNESSNFLCGVAGETMNGTERHIIGAIHLFSDKWIIYSVAYLPNNTTKSSDSEIGLFEEDKCLYRPIVQDICLNFSKFNLITGASREAEDCSWQVYWADGLNPDRYLNIGDPKTWPSSDYIWVGLGDINYYTNGTDKILWPGVNWIQDCTDTTCIECTDINELDCDRIRLARLMETPCLELNKGKTGGQLSNGSYIALIAYTIKGQKVTDWFSQSNTVPLWYDTPPLGALEITVNADSKNFSEFVLCIVSVTNQQTVAKQVGIYSTRTTTIYIDQLLPSLISIPIEQLPIQTPVFEKSDQIIEVNNYLLRVGPTSKFDFNYQPLANLIKANWVSTEYPEDYYIKDGYKPSYLRDEVYAFFIRWVYDTGDKSSSYHIPGRAPRNFNVPGSGALSEIAGVSNINSIFYEATDPEKVFEIYNTASVTSTAISTLNDGGVIVGRGDMAYWESTEKYPDNRSDIWNSSEYCWTGVSGPSTQYDLCGLPIRHHKMPDQTVHPLVNHFNAASDGNKIRILGVEFSNIIYPKDQEGNDIPNIVGYEILRGSREGNKTIIAKGMLNNLRPYTIKGNQNTFFRRGLYPNHPFNTIQPVNPQNSSLGPLNPGSFINDPYIKTVDNNGNYQQFNIGFIPKDVMTFHSPDTMFRDVFLSSTELKVYGYLAGISDQQFVEPYNHPKHKLINDDALFFMIISGIIEVVLANQGETIINKPKPQALTLSSGDPTGAPYLAQVAAMITANAGSLAYNTAIDVYLNAGEYFLDGLVPLGNPIYSGINAAYAITLGTAYGTGALYQAPYEISSQVSKLQMAGPLAIPYLGYYFAEGGNLALRIIKALIPYRQYALQMLAHGFYSSFVKGSIANTYRFKIDDSTYLKDAIQSLKTIQPGNITYTVNNLKRAKTVLLKTLNAQDQNTGPDFILNPSPNPSGTNNDAYYDNSLVTIGTARDNVLVNPGSQIQLNFNPEQLFKNFNARIASHYGALKVRYRNQYGQFDSIKQIPITPCEQKFNYSALPQEGPVCTNPGPNLKFVPNTPVLFNGDTYISRYTEKNTMLFFYDWLYGQPDGTEFNYYLRQMIPEPRFWMNSEEYDMASFVSNFNIQGLAQLISGNNPTGAGLNPKSYYKFDNDQFNYNNNTQGAFPGINPAVKESYFYLATSAVRDFFVESEMIVDFRETGVEEYQKHYDRYTYTDLERMFRIDPLNITRGNYYAYDFSLLISKLFTQYFSQGNLQSRYYDPGIAELCYTYYPDRIIYSLPQQDESLKDSWFVYLANNYKEFKDQISGVKNFAKTGIFITFKNSSPLVFQGVDQLQTDSGTKITIGDGGLFAQTPQSLVISDRPYEYGSSQNRLSVISTPAGFFYISQNQGKIFSYSQGLKEISQKGLKWWFTLFLPYKLTDDFPDYPHTDNPVAGIGCQAIYDNRNTVVYFSKKDYKLKDQYSGRVTYNASEDRFILDGTSKLKLGDPILFENASWTISYDPKSEFFISYHDWHPNLVMAGKGVFMSTKDNGIWKHNNACDSFCNYYGQDYPFEVEFPMITGQTISTIRSMEYILECYRRAKGSCIDQFHVLDFNFDQAVVYNSEQVSGYLNLNIYPKNNINLSLQYPKTNLNSYDILFSKEENKYRFNQFWDITKNRGEFPTGSGYPPTGNVIPGTTILAGPTDQENIWITQANGYIRNLNQQNLNYTKDPLQRKKFRHYLNFLTLTKNVSGNTNMILKITNSKNTYSFR
jgi:hypothetical protein